MPIRSAPPPTSSGPTAPRPRAVLAGGRLSARTLCQLREQVELQLADIRHAERVVSANPPDLLLLAGSRNRKAVERILRALPPPGSPGRPSVMLLTRSGRRTDSGLEVDDIVDLRRGESQVLCRIPMALRVRGYLTELGRKNAELGALSERFEALARRLADELRLAAIVQRSLLPPPLDHVRLEVAREFIPFREIGGDFYDLIALGPSRVALGIGDVMGKGVPAALLAANLKACLRAQLHAQLTSVDLMARVNELFRDVSPRGQFATLFFGIFDLDAGCMEYVNAGHDYPFVVRDDGSVQDLTEGGTVLGLLEGVHYERGLITLSPGDLIVFYSDGITDRTNGEGEAYGAERLRAAAVRSRADRARIVLYSLLGEVQGWCGGAPPEDDMTLAVAKLR